MSTISGVASYQTNALLRGSCNERHLRQSVPRYIVVVLCILLASHWFIGDAVSAEEMTAERAIAILDEEDAIAAGKAAIWLGRQKNVSDEAIAALIKHLGDERNTERFPALVSEGPPAVGDYAANALELIGSPEVVHAVCQFLASNKKREPRIRGLRILKSVGDAAQNATETLQPMIKDADELIRIRTIETISAVSKEHRETLPLFQQALKDNDPSVQAAAIRAIGDLGIKSKGLVPELIPLLASEELQGLSRGWEPLCIDVAVALGKIGPAAGEALPKLKALLDNENEYVQAASAFAHASISGNHDPGLKLLLRHLKERFGSAAPAALYVRELAHRQEFADASFDGLKDALNHRRTLVRVRAIEGVAAIRPSEAVPLLLEVAREDSDEWVRQTAQEAIERISQADRE